MRFSIPLVGREGSFGRVGGGLGKGGSSPLVYFGEGGGEEIWKGWKGKEYNKPSDSLSCVCVGGGKGRFYKSFGTLIWVGMEGMDERGGRLSKDATQGFKFPCLTAELGCGRRGRGGRGG